MTALQIIKLITHLETEPGSNYDREAFYKQQLLAAIEHAKEAVDIIDPERTSYQNANVDFYNPEISADLNRKIQSKGF
jgi:hypothetical protein